MRTQAVGGPCHGPNVVQEEAMEIEIKLKVESCAEMRGRILALGAVLIEPRTLEDNFLLDSSTHHLRKTGHLLRLRLAGERATLTFKEKVVGERGYKVRGELETEVSDGRTALAILQKLGFAATFRYQKYREAFRVENLHILLDEIPFGNYIELEGNRKEIDAMASRLGFSPDSYITDSYPAILLSHCRKKGISADAVLFEEDGS